MECWRAWATCVKSIMIHTQAVMGYVGHNRLGDWQCKSRETHSGCPNSAARSRIQYLPFWLVQRSYWGRQGLWREEEASQDMTSHFEQNTWIILLCQRLFKWSTIFHGHTVYAALLAILCMRADSDLGFGGTWGYFSCVFRMIIYKREGQAFACWFTLAEEDVATGQRF